MRFIVLLCFFAAARPLAAATTQPAVAKPPIVTREQWGSKPQPIPDSRRQQPKFITLHHAGVAWKAGADPAAFVRNLQAWGQRREEENAKLPADQKKKNVKNWPDLPYHFMIAPDGQIFEARPIDYEPESNTTYDLQGHIGIELMGNFEVQRPSEAQLKSTVHLVAWLCQERQIAPNQVAGHKDRAHGQTVCPGRDFERYLEDGQFLGWVHQTLTGRTPAIHAGPALPGGPTAEIDGPTTQPNR